MVNEPKFGKEKERIDLNERQMTWNKKIQEVEGWKDGANNKMDEGIIETVVALNLLGISTVQSCAGHVDEGRMPWVQINDPPDRPKGIYKPSDDVTPEYREWWEKREELWKNVEQLLEEYNSASEHEDGFRLKLDISGNITVTNDEIESISGNEDPTVDLTPDEVSRFKHFSPIAQKEMYRFTSFLRGKYFKK